MECYSARPSRSSVAVEVVSETPLTARRSFRIGQHEGRAGENGCERPKMRRFRMSNAMPPTRIELVYAV